MTKKLELYKCDICGNVIQVVLDGTGELVCCGKSMKLLQEQYASSDISEKHVPEISDYNENYKKITVYKHPMQKEHYIEFIEAYSKEKGEVYLKYLKPENKAEFITPKSEDLISREHCNIHGLWGNQFSEK